MSHDTFSLPVRQRQVMSASAALGDSPAPGFSPVRSLYLHVPFCFHKCHYCDFYSLVDTRDRQEPFVKRLVRELSALAPWAGDLPLKTIFVGGGTPSLLRVDLWDRLLAELGSLFDLSLIRGAGVPPADRGEFTVECNPETVSPELMATLAAGGVNRVSIGAQSFDPRHLKTLERWHDPANVPRALELARGAGIPRHSLDLIFGIPGQTLADWESDLRTALALGTTHLSCYNLTYEPQTALTARRDRGDFTPADEDLEVEMYLLTLETLRAAGLERYEVSNYARPGDEARHHLAYWRQEQWLAAGPSASAHVAGHRWKNVARLDDYLGRGAGVPPAGQAGGLPHGFAPVTDHETPDSRRALSEWIMTGLRLAEGLDSTTLIRRAADVSKPRLEIPARLLRKAYEHESRGHLTLADTRWSLTDAGFLVADTIAADLMSCLRP